MIGSDPNVKVDYTSTSQRSFVDHHASRPQREKKNANEASGFAGPCATSPIVVGLPKNQLSPQIIEERRACCKQTIAMSADIKKKKTSAVSQVDCSMLGATFTGVSETASSLNKTRLEAANPHNAHSMRPLHSEFEQPKQPILQCPLPFTPAAFEHPGGSGDGRSVKRVSLNCVARRDCIDTYNKSIRPTIAPLKQQ